MSEPQKPATNKRLFVAGSQLVRVKNN